MHLAHWSIAQTKHRETQASGIGWELFLNYKIARDKYKPDYFLYENNKSMSAAIKAQITEELGVEPVLINSALVSAQSRQRLYWVGKREPDGSYSRVDVEQPDDRGILLRDILESGVCWREKAYTIDANYYKTLGQQGFDTQSGRRKMVAEPVDDQERLPTAIGYRNRREADGRLYRRFEGGDSLKAHTLTTVLTDSMVAEPVRVGDMPNAAGEVRGGQTKRVYSAEGKHPALTARPNGGGKDGPLVSAPVRIGTIESGTTTEHDSKPFRVYSPDGKGVTLQGEAGGYGAKTGLYAVPCAVVQDADAETLPVYEVKDGLVTIKGRQYPIEGPDGCYTARKLTEQECKRLQTVRVDDYEFVGGENTERSEVQFLGGFVTESGLRLKDGNVYSRNFYQGKRLHGTEAKSVTVTAQPSGLAGHAGLYAVPCAGRIVGRRINEDGHRDDYNEALEHVQRLEINDDPQKTNCLSTVQKDNVVAVPMRVAEATKQGYVDIYPGECVDLAMEHSKTRRGRRMAEKSNCLTTTCALYEYCGTLDKPIYRVKDGLITIKGRQYPIKLRDGCYIIRKLTVLECKRLQTVPDDYIFPVSDTQAYKMLGNGWTVDVIAHILSHLPRIAEEPVEVLSMYDGMSCGHIALDKLGADVVGYYATEIDKYAVQTTQTNYPETVQLGDAFQVREDDWRIREENRDA